MFLPGSHPTATVSSTGPTKEFQRRDTLCSACTAFASGVILLALIAAQPVNGDLSDLNRSIPEDALDCLLEPWKITEIGSPTQGVVSKLLVERGDTVSKGQLVAELASNIENAELVLAEARATIKSEIVAREADLALARIELLRQDDLYQQEMIPLQQKDEAIARYQIASAALVQALENKKLQKLEFLRSYEQLAQRKLTSPFSGVVVEHLVADGEFVYDNPVMTIAALDPLRVEAMLPARLFGTIRKGDQALIYPEINHGGTELTAKVDVVDPLLDSRSGTFGVRLRIPNPGHLIAAGQRCRIAFQPAVAAAKPDRNSSDLTPD